LLQENITFAEEKHHFYPNPSYAATAMLSGFLGDRDVHSGNYGLAENGIVKRCDFERGLGYYALTLPIISERILRLNEPPWDYCFFRLDTDNRPTYFWDYVDSNLYLQEKFETLNRLMHMPLSRMAQALFKHIP